MSSQTRSIEVSSIEASKALTDKRLFTPGPLTTSASVKAVMMRDLGSRDKEFIHVIQELRLGLLKVAGQKDDSVYSTIPMQGSGTFGIEAVLSSGVAKNGKVLFIVNGAYGKRMVQMAEILNLSYQQLSCPENEIPNLEAIETVLKTDPDISMVAIIHCETTTGIMNPVEAVGDLAKRYGKDYFVDAMSSFGAVPLDIAQSHISYLVSSANKCIEGVPGFSFILAKKEALLKTKGSARSLSLDLLGQYEALESTGQFRFTPPIQTMLAFHQALKELQDEGGVLGRYERYRNNNRIIIEGMQALGFELYLNPKLQGPIINTFYYPKHSKFHFQEFYERLSDKDMVIYPGKLSDADCFRIGNIGRLFAEDMQALLTAIAQVKAEMGF
ncbi:MAG: 2-aminoethylphosphonate--pyruvate transaminase [Deinococcales bacterium]